MYKCMVHTIKIEKKTDNCKKLKESSISLSKGWLMEMSEAKVGISKEWKYILVLTRVHNWKFLEKNLFSIREFDITIYFLVSKRPFKDAILK